MEKIKVFEAFAGYGSQAIALKRLMRDFPDSPAFEYVGISEIEPSAIKAYKILHGNIHNFGDITKIDTGDLPDFDLFTYSFPCTSISNAGKQEGFTEGSGTASSLLWECRRIIRDKRPKYLLMENVKALLQSKFKSEFRRWIEILSDYGYNNFYQILNAKDYGVPQNRERVFMVSILRTENEASPCYIFPFKIPLEKRVEDYMIDLEDVPHDAFIDSRRLTEQVLSDILEQPNVFAELENIYHQEWAARK